MTDGCKWGLCWCLNLVFSLTDLLRRWREGERERDLSHWAQLFPRNSNWIPAAIQPNQWSLCALSIGLPLSSRHCPLCALRPRTNHRLSYSLWDSVDCISLIGTSVYHNTVTFSTCKHPVYWRDKEGETNLFIIYLVPKTWVHEVM